MTTTETPTYEEASAMMKDILLDVDCPLASKYPETYKELQQEIKEIGDRGSIVDGFT